MSESSLPPLPAIEARTLDVEAKDLGQRWQDIGLRLTQKRQVLLDSYRDTTLPAQLDKLSREDLAGLTPEQKTKAILEAMEMQGEKAAFLSSGPYKSILYDLATADDATRQKYIRDTGLGSMLAYTTIEALETLKGKDVNPRKDLSETFASIAVARTYCEDKELAQIYDEAEFVDLVIDKFGYKQKVGDFLTDLHREEFICDFFTRCLQFNSHFTPEQLRYFFVQKDIGPEVFIDSLARQAGERWRRSDESHPDYILGYNTAPEVKCQTLYEITRRGKLNEDAAVVIDRLEQELSQLPDASRKLYYLDSYTSLFYHGLVCPPFPQRFAIFDLLYNHNILDASMPVQVVQSGGSENRLGSLMHHLHFTWDTVFTNQFITHSLGSSSYEISSGAYQDFRARMERRRIAALKMDEALREDRSVEQIQDAVDARADELASHIPQLDLWKPKDIYDKSVFPTTEDDYAFLFHDRLVDSVPNMRELIIYELLDLPKNKLTISWKTTDSLTQFSIPNEVATTDKQKAGFILKVFSSLDRLAAQGAAAPIKEIFAAIDGGRVLFNLAKDNPYTTPQILLEQVRQSVQKTKDFYQRLGKEIPEIVNLVQLAESEFNTFENGLAEHLDFMRNNSNLSTDEIFKKRGISLKSATSIAQLVVAPEYLRRHTISKDRTGITQGLPRTLFSIPRAVMSDDLPTTLLADIHAQVPVTASVAPGDLILVLGPNNSGKSTVARAFADSLARCEFDTLPFALGVSRVENENGQAVSRGVGAPESEILESLFSSSVVNIAAALKAASSSMSLPPVTLRLDEWGIGTDDNARVALLYSLITHIRALRPDFSFLVVTQEGQEIYTLDKLLRLNPANADVLPGVSTLVMNPLTRQGTEGALARSLAPIAVAEIDPEIAQAAQLLESLRDLGLPALSLAGVEQFEGNDKVETGFIGRNDLYNLSFRSEKDYQVAREGDLAAFDLCIDKYPSGSSEAKKELSSHFSELFMNLAASTDEFKLDKFRQAAKRIRDLSPDQFDEAVSFVLEGLEISSLFSSGEFHPRRLKNAVELLNRPVEEVQSRFTKGAQVLRNIGFDDEFVAQYSLASKELIAQLESVRKNFYKELGKKTWDGIINATINKSVLAILLTDPSLFQVKSGIPTPKQLELISNIINSPDLDTAKTQLRNLLIEGKTDDYIAIANAIGNKKSSDEIMSKIGITTILNRLSIETEISPFLESVRKIGNTGEATSEEINSILELSRDDAFDSLYRTISRSNLISRNMQQVLDLVSETTENLLFGVGARLITREENPLGIVWTEAERIEGPTDFPVQFSGGYDPGVVHGLAGNTQYIPVDFNLPEAEKRHNLVLLSGPNFGGKTSHMVLALKMALYDRVLGMVPATSARIGKVDYLATSINAFKPNEQAGTGGLLSQALDFRRLRDLAREMASRGKRGLFALDELWLGTDSTSRRDLETAGLYQLLSLGAPLPDVDYSGDVFAFCATHDTNLDKQLDSVNAGDGKNMDYTHVAIQDHKPLYGDKGKAMPYEIFLAKLKKQGIPEGLIESIVANAKKIEEVLELYNNPVNNPAPS